MTDPYASPSSGQEPKPPVGGMTAGLPAYGAAPAGPPPGPGAPYHQQPYGGPQPPASKSMAGWAMGLSFVPCLITMVIAAVFAIIVLNRGKDGRDHGKVYAIVALCMVGLWVLVGIGAVALSLATDAERGSDGTIEESGDISAFELREGDCFDPPGTVTEEESSVYSIKAVPCDESHEAEVFATYDLGEGTEKRKAYAAQVGCAKRFKQYVGIAPERSKLDIYFMYERGSGDAVVCSVVQRSQEPMTGSLRGSKR